MALISADLQSSSLKLSTIVISSWGAWPLTLTGCVRQVRATQHAIKHVLRERWYAWEDARELYNENKAYRPSFSEEELLELYEASEAEPEDRMPVERTVAEARAAEAASRSS
jgi:hypothetical protein